MIITAETRDLGDLGYASQDSDHTVSDVEYEYEPDSAKTDEDYVVAELTEAIRNVYIERSPMRSPGFTVGQIRNCNVPINRPQTNNFHSSGGGIINTSNGFNNNISVAQHHIHNIGQPLNIIPQVNNIFNSDETSQDNLSSNPFYKQTINESFDLPLTELNGDVFLGVLLDLEDEITTTNTLINNQNLVEGKEICAFSNIPSSNSDWSSHRIHTESFSTTSTGSSVSSPAEYSPLSSSSSSDDQQSSRQSTPDLTNYFTPTLHEYKTGEDLLLIPKTVNEAEEAERWSAKQLLQKVIKQYPKQQKRDLWVAASKKPPATLMIDIRELVESNIVDQVEIRLYALVEVFLKNATTEQCKEVFQTQKPTISDLLATKEQHLLRQYVDEILHERLIFS